MAKRRHYRVAQRESQQNPARGIFIPNKKKKKIFSVAALFLVGAFIDGIILGCLISKWMSKKQEI
ncbi:MAG: hypothetical protein FWE29_01735 [Defluviitaleaceae bacterium]|nr:hypothetical protein [Defluviitaleaceae bacterium]